MKAILFNQLICRKTVLLFFISLFFSTLVFAQPANDDCGSATSLTSGTSCNNNTYRLKNATASAGIPAGCAAGGTHYDVWFQFTAVSATHTVTISNLQSNFTNPEIQLFSGACGSLTSVVCGTTTMTGISLTIGNTYYVRVSNIGTLISSNDRFDICVTHPLTPANDNCSGATTLTSTPTPTCTGVAGTLYNATNSGLAGTCTAANPTYEVWYRFTATSTTHAVTVSGLGSSLTAATTYMQLLSGACGAQANITCQTVATTGGRITSTALTIGTTYYVRVYTTVNPNTGVSANWSFSICLQNPPVNDLCANATVLTPGATCVTTAGTLDLAIPTVLAVASGCAAAGTYYDVWYRFTAASISQVITINGIGSGITAPRIQIFAACGGVPLGCASATTLTQAGLVIGTQYWVSISNFTTNPSGTGGVADFNICITNVITPPGNDNCSGAILLTSGTACSNIAGTLINATASAPLVPGLCGNALAPDVWFRFVAQSAFPLINLSSIGALMQTNGRMQLLTGSCGSLVQVGSCFNFPTAAAATLNTINNPGDAGLTIGQTYYIRITHNTLLAPVGAGTYTFNICITDPAPLPVATIDYAKSYVNITSGTVGGTINPGDVLEIRATLVIRNPGSGATIDSIAYYDTLKTGSGFALIAGSIATRSNEGKIFQSFTDASGDADAGWYTTAGAGTDTAIQMNLGPTGSRTARGTLSNTSKPSLFTTVACVTMATYRVVVNAAYGTKINYGGGAFTYRDPVTGAGIKIAFPKDSLMVYQSVGICPNNASQTNILGDEFSGTFGTPVASAGSQNRGTSPNTSYSYQAFNPGGPGDYFYGVPNNTSADNSIVQTLPKPTGAPRVFGHWDITGDHTGAANTAKGNKPCNPALPKSLTNPCGYMLVVNAAYRTDVAFSFTVSGACPNTYYEISSWVKNICYKCGCDVNGKSSSDASGPPFYIPTAPGDSSGVRPNLAYEINGVDYYTTGDIVYQGLGGTQTGSDTLNTWLQKAFVYKTGPMETGFVITIRNNAPGGGGNDWALDDISLRTCYPNMSYSPSVTPNVCAGSTITITDTVRSIFNTYTEYKWQRSTNGGVTWIDIAGTTATATPVVVNGMYQFITSYTVPAAFTTLANNGDQYRLVVATTVANLTSTCNYSDAVPITITVRQPSVAPTSVTGADICNGSSTTLTAVGATLGASANYQWGTGAVVGTSPIAGATSSTLTVSPTTTTTYWVRIENTVAAPCPANTSGLTKTITVSQPSAAPTSVTGIDICNGSSTTLTAVGATLGTSANYQWGTGSTVGTSPIVGATGSTLVVSPTSTTTYWVRIENTAGPCTANTSGLTKTITVTQPSAAPTSVTGADICNPGSTTLTAIGATLGTSANYQWGTGAVVGTSPIGSATSSTLIVSPVVTTTYWVRIENTLGPCTATTSGITKVVTVSQPSVGPSSITAPSTTICNGSSVTLTAVGATLGTGATYQWGTGAVVGTSPIGGANSSTLSVSPTTTTTYWIRVENTASPCTANVGGITVTITVNQPSAAPTSVTGADICNGGSTTLTAVGATLGTGATYQWGTGAVVGTSPIGGANSSTLTVSPTTTTTYWVRIENTTAPCSANTGGLTKTVTVNQPSAAPTSVTGIDICNGSSTTLTAVGATLGTSANYQWGTGSTVGTSPIVGATGSTLLVSPTSTTTYWVRVENTAGPCTANTSGLTKTITVTQPSAAPTSVTGADICNPGSTTLTAVGATLGTSANYQWGTGSTVGTSPIVGATGSTLFVSPTSTTTYWVRIENTAGPCTPTTSGITKTVTVNQPSAAPTSVTGSDFCNPGSTTLTALGATLGTSANYQWGTGAVAGISPIVGATSSTLTVSPIVTTTYWVRIENNAGPCSPTTGGVTKTITVSQPSVAAASAAKNKNNICPGISVNLSVVGGTLGTSATWKWYTGACGTTLAGSGATLSVTPLVTTTYWVRAEGSCNTTTCQAVTIAVSCDIDKDKDGIPDWVESNIAAAFQDDNSDGLINAYDPAYPGFVDNNNDYLNDSFQADGDSDNDGLPNYLDLDFAGRVDVNSDGIDDRFDTDLDGKINMIDKDSDNDGVPDVVEAYGVDTNGDGGIDNFVDADGDGLSDQVDANLTNAYNSGVGLSRPDFDVDGVPNYLDLDSDNDGIPDIVEVGEPDTNNDGRVDGFTDVNGDGLHDGYINATALLITGADTNSDGRADSYPNKNMDMDFRPNAYDMDADGDGIVDVIEAGLPDVNFDGQVDGTIAANGWSTSVSALPALNVRSTDADSKPDYLDIDSDNDGIPDNIEGQTTIGYKLPALIDADGDGLMLPYDNTPAAFGGSGILVYDHDGDNTPDYRDLDSDADGLIDRVEGNDFNLNGRPDDNVTLTGLDTDADGLDNRFDSLNSVTNIKGTSYRMGTGGTFTGDAAPGSRCTVQKTFAFQTDRDWRYAGYVLPVEFLNLTGVLQADKVLLNWAVIADKAVDHFEVERSLDNNTFIKTGIVSQPVTLNVQQNFTFRDDVAAVNKEIIYYRIKVVAKNGEIQYSNILIVRKQLNKTGLSIVPNPAKDNVSVSFVANTESVVTIRLIDDNGKMVLLEDRKVSKGNNTIQLTGLEKYSSGVYIIQVYVNNEVVTQKLILLK